MAKNVNIGLMGHVDSGKTSIAKCLSSIAGTACFDKSPQSQSRGITLDLGFSTFKLSEESNVTIVDCPGHASLIRTVLCGAQIIDIIVLVIDGTKGIQAQTAECLILAEIMSERVVFVVNKIDLWPDRERIIKFESIKKKLKLAMKDGKFSDSPIVAFSTIFKEGIDELKKEIAFSIEIKPIERNLDGNFVFAVDHCFPIKGTGTIFTGTVLQGKISVNEMIEIPHISTCKKIKSIQKFKENVKEIEAGDRAGICVGQSSTIDSEFIDRALICVQNNPIPKRKIIHLKAKKIKWFKGELKSKSKMHVSVLNEVVLCKQLIFVRLTEFGFEYLEELDLLSLKSDESFDVIIELEKSINILPNSIVIVSKFDTDPSLQRCRIAFHGRWIEDEEKDVLDNFNIYRVKERIFSIDRFVDETRLIVKSYLKNGNFISKFIGMKVSITNKSEQTISYAKIDSLFGNSGKFNLTFIEGIKFDEGFRNNFVKLKFGKVLFKEEHEIFDILQ